MNEELNGYKRKYYSNKDFSEYGITDKNKYLNWYATAVYFTAHQMICAYYYKTGQPIPRAGQDLIIVRALSKIKTDIDLLESKMRVSLYGGLDVRKRDAESLKTAFDRLEKFMLPRIA